MLQGDPLDIVALYGNKHRLQKLSLQKPSSSRQSGFDLGQKLTDFDRVFFFSSCYPFLATVSGVATNMVTFTGFADEATDTSATTPTGLPRPVGVPDGARRDRHGQRPAPAVQHASARWLESVQPGRRLSPRHLLRGATSSRP